MGFGFANGLRQEARANFLSFSLLISNSNKFSLIHYEGGLWAGFCFKFRPQSQAALDQAVE